MTDPSRHSLYSRSRKDDSLIDFAAKILDYDLSLNSDPDNIHLLFARACSLLAHGEVQRAMKDFNRVSDLELSFLDCQNGR